MIGQVLGHYRIIAPLGAGGMGVVYRAHDERLDREVALKLIPPEQFDDEAARKRFQQEARMLSRLSHPNIATLLDFDSDRVQYIVMELVAGVSLRQKLAQGALTTREIIPIGIQIAQGLAAAHQVGVVHRDLKPENVMITDDGHVKILDFGLAKFTPRALSTTITTSSYMSEPGVISGTLPYMAPEQLRGEAPDPSFDIYSAGAVLYEMAAGRRPFEDRGPTLIDAILNINPPAPSTVNPRSSLGLDPIILKALDKDSRRRYHSARELAIDLERVTATTTRPAMTPGFVRAWRWRSVLLPLAVFVLPMAGVWLGTRRGGPSSATTTGASIQSIAVLPLENISGDPQQEYFADGMTEELTSDLAKISALRVISRTSVMQYKNTRKTAPQIAQELNVDAVIEGSVQRAGDRVRITAQLINARLDRHMWSQSYERELRDVLTLQSEVAQAIAGEIKVTLTPREHEQLTLARPTNPEAHEAYLQGRFYWNKMTGNGLQKAIQYYDRAIEKDPGYARAYVGLASCHAVLAVNYANPSEEWPKAKAASARALELDGSVENAHVAIGAAKLFFDWDWAGAEKEFQRSLELNPNSVDGYNLLAYYFQAMGRPTDAIAALKRARELDPLSLIINTDLAGAYYYARRYDEAIERFRKTLEMDSDFPTGHFQLAQTYEQKAMYREAVAEFQKASALEPESPNWIAGLAHGRAKAGQRAEAQKLLKQLSDMSGRKYVDPYWIAFVHMGLGDKDEAFVWLDKAVAAHSGQFVWFSVDPASDPLRDDPRFQDLLRRLGLPQEPLQTQH